MHARDLLPWNWHSRNVDVARSEHDPLAQLQANVNRVFDGFFDDTSFLSPAQSSFLPALDVANDEEGLRVTLELAGLDEKDIDVSVDDDVLVIRGEKRSEEEKTREGVRWSERRYGAFRRGIPLPPGLDLDAVDAKFEKGVLRVRVPRSEEAKQSRRSVPIQSA